MSDRRTAREYALQILFQYDFPRGIEKLDLALFWEDKKTSTPVREFSNLLVKGVLSHQAEIDALLRECTEHWSLERMAVVDRNTLRIATFEILHLSDIPAKVSINEALEIIKKYGDDQSSAFINGILDQIVHQDVRVQTKREDIERTLDEDHRSV